MVMKSLTFFYTCGRVGEVVSSKQQNSDKMKLMCDLSSFISLQGEDFVNALCAIYAWPFNADTG